MSTNVTSSLPIPKPIEAGRTHVRPMDIVRSTGLSKGMVMSEIYCGRLKGFRVGRAWLIPTEEFDRWLRSYAAAA